MTRDPQPFSRRLIIWAAALAIVTVLVYAFTWNQQLLYWDDDVNVLENPLVVSPGPAGLTRIFTSLFSTDYYPLTYLSLAFDQFLWRGHFWGYHVTQTLLHGLNVFLVVLLVARWTGTRSVALLAGAWFAWHPLQVETVAWIAERKNVLGTALLLLAWLAYLRADSARPANSASCRSGCRLVAVLLFTAAALTHALVIVLPALLLAYELVVRRTRLRAALRSTWLFFLPAAFAAAMRMLGHAESGQLAAPFGSITEGVLTMTAVVGQYLTSLVWPVDLSNHYTVAAVGGFADPRLAVTAAWVLMAAALWWRAPAQRSWILFAALWFLVALAPVLQLVPHPTLRADRYLYLAALGPFVLVARFLAANTRVLRVAGSVTAAALLVLTAYRIPDWHDATSLWTDCLAKNPRDVVAHYSLAGRLVVAHDWPGAERHLREAVALKPGFAEAHERLGGVLFIQRNRDEAREHLERALALNPGLVEARRNLQIIESLESAP